MIEWQTLIVALVLMGACFYVGRRAWLRIRLLRISNSIDEAACGGCSGCGAAKLVKVSDKSSGKCPTDQ